MKMSKAFMGEFLGTFLLVFGGVGAAVLGGPALGLMGVALCFGLAVMAGAYAFGPMSGGHFNPAVSIGLAIAGKFNMAKVPMYIVAQVLGGVIAAGLLFVIMQTRPEFAVTEGFASNGFGELSPFGFGMTAGIITEIIVTFIFLMVIIGTTKKSFPPAMGGLVVGLTLAMLIMVSGPVTNASLNPARSLSTAVFEGGNAISQLWVFLVAPTVGAILAGLLSRMCCGSCTDGSCDA